MKIQNLAALALIALSTSAFAGNPKGETKDTKDAKIEVPTASKSESTLLTYFVTGSVGDQYTLTPSGSNNPDCLVTQSPCEITSPTPLSSPIDKELVDDEQNNIEIISRQPQLP